MSRLDRMWQRGFDAAFLRYRAMGLSEDSAIVCAERDADIGLDQYCEEKGDERREGG